MVLPEADDMALLKRLIGWVVVLPLTVLAIALAVANRKPVTIAWNPLEAADPNHGITLPLFLVVFSFFIVGVLVGGFVVWNAQRPWRRAAKEHRRTASSLRAEVERLKSPSPHAALAGPR